MKYSILILLIFAIINSAKADNLDDRINEVFADSFQTNDNLNDTSFALDSDFERWSQEDFTIAGSPRYTVTGALPYKDTHIKPINFIAFTGTYIGFMVAQHILQMETIWKEQSDFKIMEDGKYAMQADKAGHIFGCFLTSYMMSEGFLQAGLSWDASTVWGAVMGLSYSTYVEILDGYAKGWGFSPSDFYANVGGASFFVLQHYVPFLQNFTPKFSYIPARWHGERKRYPSEMFIDDYSSHTLWMSINVHNLLPNNLKPYWPDWLELSVGYAVRHLCDTYQQSLGYCEPCMGDKWVDGFYFGSPRYILALDYNLIKILPEGGFFWNWLRQSLNYFKLPSPALEFGRNTKFYLVYPFHIQL